jgi:hypothetical protein
MPRQRIMFIECKGDSLTGEASGTGFKANYFDVETREHYWISGCKKNGEDRLYGERLPIFIDEDVREAYWVEIRNMPEQKHITRIH